MPAELQKKGKVRARMQTAPGFMRLKGTYIPQITSPCSLNSSSTESTMLSRNPNIVSIPSSTSTTQKINNQKLGQGSIAIALGNTLKARSVPLRLS